MDTINIFAASTEPTNALGAAVGVIGVMLMIVFYLLMLAIPLAGLVLWIIALIHVIQHEDIKDRVTWILVVALTGWIGGIIYYFAVKRPYDQGGVRDPNYRPPIIN